MEGCRQREAPGREHGDGTAHRASACKVRCPDRGCKPTRTGDWRSEGPIQVAEGSAAGAAHPHGQKKGAFPNQLRPPGASPRCPSHCQALIEPLPALPSSKTRLPRSRAARERRSPAACTAAVASMLAPASSTAPASCPREWGSAGAAGPRPALPAPLQHLRRPCRPPRPSTGNPATPAAAPPAARCAAPAALRASLGACFLPARRRAAPPPCRTRPARLPQKNFDSKSQTLRALTIKQLADASAQRVDDTLVIDGRDVSNVRRPLRFMPAGVHQGGRHTAGLHFWRARPLQQPPRRQRSVGRPPARGVAFPRPAHPLPRPPCRPWRRQRG